MRSDAMDAVRNAVNAACPTLDDLVSAPQLAAMLDISGESQMQILRRRLAEMVRCGELEKVAQGKWKRTGKKPILRGAGYQRMWRAIRTAKGHFSTSEIAQLARVERSGVSKYLYHLEDKKLVRRAGRDGNSILFMLTSEGREERKTPYPSVDIVDPYHAESAATAALCRIFLLEDLKKPSVRRKIKEHLTILNNRFAEEKENDDEHYKPA